MDKQFNWIAFIDNLAGGDITKYDAVYEIPYQVSLHKMLYNHHKDKYMNEINRRQELQRR